MNWTKNIISNQLDVFKCSQIVLRTISSHLVRECFLNRPETSFSHYHFYKYKCNINITFSGKFQSHFVHIYTSEARINVPLTNITNIQMEYLMWEHHKCEIFVYLRICPSSLIRLLLHDPDFLPKNPPLPLT